MIEVHQHIECDICLAQTVEAITCTWDDSSIPKVSTGGYQRFGKQHLCPRCYQIAQEALIPYRKFYNHGV